MNGGPFSPRPSLCSKPHGRIERWRVPPDSTKPVVSSASPSSPSLFLCLFPLSFTSRAGSANWGGSSASWRCLLKCCGLRTNGKSIAKVKAAPTQLPLHLSEHSQLLILKGCSDLPLVLGSFFQPLTCSFPLQTPLAPLFPGPNGPRCKGGVCPGELLQPPLLLHFRIRRPRQREGDPVWLRAR